MMKNFQICGYFKPTPKRFRILGDTLLSISVFATSYGIINEEKTLALTTLVIGCVGKFLTNFFIEEENKNEQQ